MAKDFIVKKTGEMRPKMVVSCVGIGKNKKKTENGLL